MNFRLLSSATRKCIAAVPSCFVVAVAVVAFAIELNRFSGSFSFGLFRTGSSRPTSVSLRCCCSRIPEAPHTQTHIKGIACHCI